jgi:alkylhydroperoxidase family enzyme
VTARIDQVEDARATSEQQAARDEELRLRGRMTNMKRTLLHSPVALRVYGEWFALRGELLPVIGDRAIFAFALAICRASGSVTGTTFMRRALTQLGADPDRLALSGEERELAAFGEAIGRDPKSLGDAEWAPLKARYDDKTLVDLVAFAGIMVATNVFTDSVGTPLDIELEPYRAAE